jgi:hypothetical protein
MKMAVMRKGSSSWGAISAASLLLLLLLALSSASAPTGASNDLGRLRTVAGHTGILRLRGGVSKYYNHTAPPRRAGIFEENAGGLPPVTISTSPRHHPTCPSRCRPPARTHRDLPLLALPRSMALGVGEAEAKDDGRACIRSISIHHLCEKACGNPLPCLPRSHISSKGLSERGCLSSRIPATQSSAADVPVAC